MATQVEVSTYPVTIEECMGNSRLEAIQLARKVEQLVDEAFRAGEKFAQATHECRCERKCGLDYHIDSPLLYEDRQTTTLDGGE